MAETTPFTDTRQFKVMRRVMGALNPLMKRLIASRFGGPLGRRLLVLRYQGRKSGRIITTPAGYVRDGDRVVIVTNPTYGWWRNFTGGGDAELHLPGRGDGRADAAEGRQGLLVVGPARERDQVGRAEVRAVEEVENLDA